MTPTRRHIVVEQRQHHRGRQRVVGLPRPWQEHISISSTDTFEVRRTISTTSCRGRTAKKGSPSKTFVHGKVYGNHVYNLNHVGIYVDAELSICSTSSVSERRPRRRGDGLFTGFGAGWAAGKHPPVNNIAYDNLVGLWLSACCTATHPFQDITVVNNTFATMGAMAGAGASASRMHRYRTWSYRNNICSQNVYSQMAADPSILPELTGDHNLTDGDS